MRFSLGSWCIFPLVAGLVLAINYAAAQQRGSSADSNPCVSKLNCSECIRTPTCAWCAQHVTNIESQILRRSLSDFSACRILVLLKVVDYPDVINKTNI